MRPKNRGPFIKGFGEGFCTGYPTPGYKNPIKDTSTPKRNRSRVDFGRRYGWGRVFGWCCKVTPEQEAEILKEQAKAMEDGIKTVNERIKELEKAMNAK